MLQINNLCKAFIDHCLDRKSIFDSSPIVSNADFENIVVLNDIVVQPKVKRPTELPPGKFREFLTAKTVYRNDLIS